MHLPGVLRRQDCTLKPRPLIIAAVVTVAALACVVPWWWEIWLWVAYEERTRSRNVYYVKNADGLPGPKYYMPDQTCPGCRRGMHSEFCDLPGGFSVFVGGDKDWRKGYVRYARPTGSRIQAYCTCPTCHPERER